MEQLQHQVETLIWMTGGSLILSSLFAFFSLVGWWSERFPNNSGERRRVRTEERHAEQEATKQVNDIASQIQAAIAAEIARHTEVTK